MSVEGDGDHIVLSTLPPLSRGVTGGYRVRSDTEEVLSYRYKSYLSNQSSSEIGGIFRKKSPVFSPSSSSSKIFGSGWSFVSRISSFVKKPRRKITSDSPEVEIRKGGGLERELHTSHERLGVEYGPPKIDNFGEWIAWQGALQLLW